MKTICTLLALATCVTGAACSEDRTASLGPFRSYQESNITIIGVDPEIKPESSVREEEDPRITVSSPVGEGECILVSDNLCVPTDTEGSTWCERDGGPVDIILVDGEVVEVVCYPPAEGSEEGRTEVIGAGQSGDIDILQTANNTAVTFAAETDGQPLVGDVFIDGNNVSFYGNGPGETVIDGDVTVAGNNVRLRGLTITGNLYIEKNDAAVVLCTVYGDVTFADRAANGAVLAENDLFGRFLSPSNGNVLAGNEIAGAWLVDGHDNVCDANAAFVDVDADLHVDPDERGDSLGCF